MQHYWQIQTFKLVDLLSDLCVLVADHAVDLVDAAPDVRQLDVLHQVRIGLTTLLQRRVQHPHLYTGQPCQVGLYPHVVLHEFVVDVREHVARFSVVRGKALGESADRGVQFRDRRVDARRIDALRALDAPQLVLNRAELHGLPSDCRGHRRDVLVALPGGTEDAADVGFLEGGCLLFHVDDLLREVDKHALHIVQVCLEDDLLAHQ